MLLNRASAALYGTVFFPINFQSFIVGNLLNKRSRSDVFTHPRQIVTYQALINSLFKVSGLRSKVLLFNFQVFQA